MQRIANLRWLNSAVAVLSLIIVLASPSPVASAETHPLRMQLWPGLAPVGNGHSETNNATITIHRPDKPNGTAIVICPGGGYGGLVVGPEGHGIAGWLNEHGITGVVLEYRLPAGRPFVPLLDAQRAIRVTRARAEAWRLGIGDCGLLQNDRVAGAAQVFFECPLPAAAGLAGDDQIQARHKRQDLPS